MSSRSVVADCVRRKVLAWAERYSGRVKWTIRTVDASSCTSIGPWQQLTNVAGMEIYEA